MNQRLKWVLGLGALGAGALGLMIYGAKKASAGAISFVQLPLKPGNQTATISKGGTIDLVAPTGSTPIGAEASPNVFSPEPSPAPLTFRFSAFASGPGAINVSWTDSTGAPQNAFVQVAVS